MPGEARILSRKLGHEAAALRATFRRCYGDAVREFGSLSLQVLGLCDGQEGVHWTAYVRPNRGAFLGVNLEGMKYDGWPVARLIERERDREAAQQAFGKFLEGGAYTADQIRFIHKLIDELTRTGVMDAHRLFEQPFTEVHEGGVAGLFQQETADILQILAAINRNGGWPGAAERAAAPPGGSG